MARYQVTVCRFGWADVDADTPEHAISLVNHDYKTDWIEWSEQWCATDADEYTEEYV
jgi:hypothetical protein